MHPGTLPLFPEELNKQKKRDSCGADAGEMVEEQSMKRILRRGKGLLLFWISTVLLTGCGSVFFPDDKINYRTYKIYDEFDAGLAEVSLPFYNQEGYVEPESIPGLFDAVESELEKGIDEGTILSYDREDENHCIVINYKSGITELYMPKEETILSGSGSSYITTMEPSRANFSTGAYEVFTHLALGIMNEFGEFDLPYHGALWPANCAHMVTDAYGETYTYNDIGADNDFFSKLPMNPQRTITRGFDIARKAIPLDSLKTGKYQGEQVTLDAVDDIGKAKVVIWEGHGAYPAGYHSCLVTGHPVTMFNKSKYKDDLDDHSLLVTSRELSLEYILGAIDALSLDTYYVVTSKYIDKHIEDGSLDGALVFLGACFSAKDDTLAESLINKGADVVFGYSDSVDMPYEMYTRAYIFYYMSQGMTPAQAMKETFDLWGAEDQRGGCHARLRALYSDASMADTFSLDPGFVSQADSEDSGPSALTSAADLDKMRDDPAGNYTLAADIDLSDRNWQPVGSADRPFTGTFDGNGHTISGLQINADSTVTSNVGFFGCVRNGSIKNLKLEDVTIQGTVRNSGSQDRQFVDVGGIAGQLTGNTVLEHCSVSGQISSIGRGETYSRVGGIAGGISGGGNIRNCFVDVSLTADAEAANSMGGGITGWLQDSSVEKCLFAGTLHVSNEKSYSYAGGICASGGNMTVDASAVTAEEITASGSKVYNHPVSLFAGLNKVIVSDQVTGNFTNTEGVSLLDSGRMKSRDTYEELGWDLSTTWDLKEEGPVLR